jgi:hypothetical protein
VTRYGDTTTCDLCGDIIPIADDAELPDKWLMVGVEANKHMNGHVCPKCRYYGGTVEFLQWGLTPDKFSVDIMGALNSTIRLMDNINQYLGDLRIQVSSRYGTTEDNKPIFRTITNIEQCVAMARSNDVVAIAELKEFGK